VPERAGGSPHSSRSRLQQAAAIALVLATLGFALGRCALSPEIPFIRQSEAMSWIAPAEPVSGALQQWGREAAPVARFETRFEARRGEPASLRLRALGRFEVHLNGAPLAGARGDGWRWRRETRVELGTLVRDGENRLRVDVSNPLGPPLLSLRIDGAAPLRSDASWQVAVDGEPRAAVLADDTRINPTSLATETPLEAVARQRDTLLLLFVLGALAFALGRRLGRGALLAPAALPLAAALGASAAWLAWMLDVVSRVPAALGFDARHHLAYVELLASRRALPLATDGWSTFHPPLFYALAWWVGPSAARWLPWLAGLGLVWVALATARRALPGDPRAQLLAVLFAAVLPVNLYTSAYFSNESLHALLAGTALLAALGALLAERSGALAAAGIGALFGLAALAKFTVLLVVPVVGVLLAAKWWRIEGLAPRRAAGRAAAFAAAFLGVAGWYYARNWILLGAPLVGNWELPGRDRVWWQQPGFHTLAWYTSFGQSLVHPYLSGFHGFADAVYSTFWGDGHVAGRVNASDRHGFWRYDFMSAGYWAALPATLLLAAGAIEALRRALTDADPRRRAAFSLLTASVWVVGVAFLYLTLRLPFYAQARAAYLLMLAGPLSVFFALGAGRLDAALSPWPPARAVLWGWLALFAGTLFLGFGIG